MALTSSKPRDAIVQDRESPRSSSVNTFEPVNGTVIDKEFEGQRSSEQPANSSLDWPVDGEPVGAATTEQPRSCVTNNSINSPRKAEFSSPACPVRMDYPDSPTQSNGSRNYDQYLECSNPEQPNPSVPAGLEQHQQTLTQTSFHEPRSLKDDDTGAVNFSLDNIPGTHTAESPSLDSPGLDHFDTLPSQEPTRPQFWPPPETPAPQQNPFSKNRSQLLATSQLFKGTQYSSAVRPQISPTSSRPSPHFPNNSISPNPISSPVKSRGLPDSIFPATSSPPVPLGIISSQPREEHDSLVDDTGYAKLRPALEPMGTYVPMQKSQERRSTSEARSEPPSPDSSIDGDDEIDRRRRARHKKEAALKQLTSISFSRHPRSENVEVPSTNIKKRAFRMRTREYLPQGGGGAETSDDLEAPEDTVKNSQTQPEIPGNYSSSQAPRSMRSTRRNKMVQGIEKAISMSSIPSNPPASFPGRNVCTLPPISTEIDFSSRDAIPETSPIDKRTGRFSSMPGKTSSGMPESSYPAVSSAIPGEQGPHEIQPGPSLSARSSPARPSVTQVTKDSCLSPPQLASLIPCEEAIGDCGDSSPSLPALNASQVLDLPSSPPALSTGAKERQPGASAEETPAAPPSPPCPAPLPSTSSLSSLSSTPPLSTSTTPATPASASAEKAPFPMRDTNNSSPAVAKNRRRLELGALPKLKTAAEDHLGASSRRKRQRLSCSTDELTRSPSLTPTFEQSLRNPRIPASRLVRTFAKPQPVSREQSCRGTKIFEGTAFAISFQSKKPSETADQYSERMKLAKTIETKISQAGGRIVDGGFDELFENLHVKSATTSPISPSQPDSEIKLVPGARSLGFTALIADGHSRKVKYMQALALGLPCIASRWVTACLDRNELVDWAPYLLCAGQSAFLGDAIRSRNLAPYDPAGATLAGAVERRPRLLAGSGILLVMKRSEEGKKMAYIFLARALGASLSRVYSLEEARAMLKAAEDLGRPFDWVYVDEKVGKGALFMPAGAEGGGGRGESRSKKRKRGVAAASAAPPPGPPPKKIRTLSDELVIQSLILGRLIEEGEMEE